MSFPQPAYNGHLCPSGDQRVKAIFIYVLSYIGMHCTKASPEADGEEMCKENYKHRNTQTQD